MSTPIAVEFQGVVYISRNEAIRQTGASRGRIKREAIIVPAPPKSAQTDNGAAAAALRIELAAEKIREIAKAQQIEGEGTQIEIYKRRKGLLKAIYNFRQRYGCGISEYL